MPYNRILIALDGSELSDMAADAALSLAGKNKSCELIGCHAYAANLHRTRFADMEPGLPGDYKGEKLNELRKTHEDLIAEGLRMISKTYLDPLAKRAISIGVNFRSLTPEGRNYVEILRAANEKGADLVAVGANGLGKSPFLGSTAERVLLYSQQGDTLIVRRPWRLDGEKIAVAIDGSENSFTALKKAIDISVCHSDANVRAIAVYDPFFHSEIFKNILSSFSNQPKEHFDFETQEKVHDEVIDEGLERLYGKGLDDAVKYAESSDQDISAGILTGKIYSEISKYVSEENIGLLILGRWGLHREKESLIGANALNLARLAKTNVLVVSPRSTEEMALRKD